MGGVRIILYPENNLILARKLQYYILKQRNRYGN